MAEVFAGVVAGYAIALLSTPVAAIGLVKLRATSPLLARILPEGVSATPLAVIIHGVLFFACTGLGIVLGLLLLAMKDSGAALGSLNAAFTLFVAGLTLALIAPFAVVLKPARKTMAIGAVTVVLVFGWLMPYLATWSKFDDPPAKQKQGPQISWQATLLPRNQAREA